MLDLGSLGCAVLVLFRGDENIAKTWGFNSTNRIPRILGTRDREGVTLCYLEETILVFISTFIFGGQG